MCPPAVQLWSNRVVHGLHEALDLVDAVSPRMRFGEGGGARLQGSHPHIGAGGAWWRRRPAFAAELRKKRYLETLASLYSSMLLAMLPCAANPHPDTYFALSRQRSLVHPHQYQSRNWMLWACALPEQASIAAGLVDDTLQLHSRKVEHNVQAATTPLSKLRHFACHRTHWCACAPELRLLRPCQQLDVSAELCAVRLQLTLPSG
jgi:hypothetical protein